MVLGRTNSGTPKPKQQYGVAVMGTGSAGPVFGYGTTGKLGHAWHLCMASVHGSVHGAGWLGGSMVYLLEPVTSLLGGCYMRWIDHVEGKLR